MSRAESERLIPDAWAYVDDKATRGTIANHKPVCGGRCLILTHPKVPVWPYGSVNLLPISVIMVCSPMVFWFIFVAPDLWTRVHPILPIMGALMLVDCLVYLVLAWMTEPGIMHTTHDEARHNKGQWMVKCPLTQSEFDLVQFRAKFCRETENCIEGFDHFCPWIGNAVGARNYRYFVLFVGSVCVLAAYIVSTCFVHVWSQMKVDDVKATANGATAQEFSKALVNSVPSMLLAVYSTIILLTVTGLFGYHLSLIAKNQTTNEDLKEAYKNAVNPHSKGCAVNCWNFLCLPPRESVVTALAFHNQEDVFQALPVDERQRIKLVPTIRKADMERQA